MKKPKWKPSWAKGDPNLLLLDPSYIKHLNEQRDYAQHLAKKLDRESKRRIKPDWDKWPDTVPVLLWEAIALSLNCEPKCLPGLGRDPLKPLLDFEKCPAEFRRRLEIAKKRISELEVNSESCIRVEEKEVILSRLVAMSQSLIIAWKFPAGYPRSIPSLDDSERRDQPTQSVGSHTLSKSATKATGNDPCGVKGGVLVEKHRSQWKTIEADLKNAKNLGLSNAAKISHGIWDETKAVGWAISRGKYKEKKPPASPFPTAD